MRYHLVGDSKRHRYMYKTSVRHPLRVDGLGRLVGLLKSACFFCSPWNSKKNHQKNRTSQCQHWLDCPFSRKSAGRLIPPWGSCRWRNEVKEGSMYSMVWRRATCIPGATCRDLCTRRRPALRSQSQTVGFEADNDKHPRYPYPSISCPLISLADPSRQTYHMDDKDKDNNSLRTIVWCIWLPSSNHWQRCLLESRIALAIESQHH
ncbi:hypothetical protein GALMADRAFT_1152544 [Galerina marginata CBS 339.88]|uniref:Uncharacterized protein n=1 Tax=Galerina marginata (strain CBS 339.88) TaxID=685588 RepID=A0A067SI96_GALM3|nr:hypothetical protein GALMADRAFT_1152544 [Galerina marginata CBS 339.88]